MSTAIVVYKGHREGVGEVKEPEIARPGIGERRERASKERICAYGLEGERIAVGTSAQAEQGASGSYLGAGQVTVKQTSMEGKRVCQRHVKTRVRRQPWSA